MPQPPAELRAVTFFDGQNLFHAARSREADRVRIACCRRDLAKTRLPPPAHPRRALHRLPAQSALDRFFARCRRAGRRDPRTPAVTPGRTLRGPRPRNRAGTSSCCRQRDAHPHNELRAGCANAVGRARRGDGTRDAGRGLIDSVRSSGATWLRRRHRNPECMPRRSGPR